MEMEETHIFGKLMMTISRDAGGFVAYGAARDIYTGRFIKTLWGDSRPQTA